MGRSAECADGTLVLLEGASHEPRDEPQDSLRATPRRRLPIEKEPCVCEQEAEESVVTTKPPEMIANVDGMASLGGEPAERTCGIADKGDETLGSAKTCDSRNQGYTAKEK